MCFITKSLNHPFFWGPIAGAACRFLFGDVFQVVQMRLLISCSCSWLFQSVMFRLNPSEPKSKLQSALCSKPRQYSSQALGADTLQASRRWPIRWKWVFIPVGLKETGATKARLTQWVNWGVAGVLNMSTSHLPFPWWATETQLAPKRIFLHLLSTLLWGWHDDVSPNL